MGLHLKQGRDRRCVSQCGQQARASIDAICCDEFGRQETKKVRGVGGGLLVLPWSPDSRTQFASRLCSMTSAPPEKTASFLSFPHVCPEPVLAK
jgi:hypothetical protein